MDELCYSLSRESNVGNETSINTKLNLAYFLRQKEVFFSEDIETNVPVECFRGKANVKIFMPDVDTVADFLAGVANTTRKTTQKTTTNFSNNYSNNPSSDDDDGKRDIYRHLDCISDEDRYFYIGKYNACDKSVECAHVEIAEEFLLERELVSLVELEIDKKRSVS